MGMGEAVMKITDHQDGEVYWHAGHDHSDARESFGEDIDVVDMVALPAEAEAEMTRFCERVELGEVRSVRTYAAFCRILGRESR